MKFTSLILLFSLIYSPLVAANYNLQWEHGDMTCPTENEFEKYIEVPLFHDLNSMAQIDRIPGLDTHEELRQMYDGAKINLFYEHMDGWKDGRELLFLIPGGPGQPHADLHGLLTVLLQEAPDLINNYNIIAMDHRGVGCSKPLFPGIEPYQSLYMRQAASDIELIKQKLVGDEKIHVWGYSYGSILSQTYALLYPDSVKRLMLGGSVSSYKDFHLAGTTYVSNVFSAVPPRKAEEFMKLTEDKLQLREAFLDWSFSPLYSYLGRTESIPEKVAEGINAIKDGNIIDFENSLTTGAWVIEWMMQSIACGEIFPNKTKYDNEYFIWKSMHSCQEFEGLSEYFDYTGLLHQIEVPTLIYGGAFDHVTPAPAMVKMAQQIENSFIFIDPYMGHGFIEKITCFAKMNDQFFAGATSEELETLAASLDCSGLPKLRQHSSEAPESPNTKIIF